MDTELFALLQKFGFSDKEAMVYGALLELRIANITQISKRSGLKRSIIYVIIGTLLERGAVTELPKKSVATYQAVDPSAILFDAKRAVKDFADMLPFWQSLKNKGQGRPRMHFIDTDEGIQRVYEKMFEPKYGYFITSYSHMNNNFPGVLDDYIKRMKKGAIKLRGHNILPDNKEERAIGKRLTSVGQRVRYLPKGTTVGMDFAISESAFAITLLEEKPSLVLFESADLAHSMKVIFDIVWKSSVE